VSTSTRSLKRKVYHETKEMIVITAYLWIVFVLLEVHKSVIVAENHINVASHAFALINALALAKVMVVARAFHLGDVTKETAPLVYPTIRKAAVYTLLLACFKIVEDAAVGLYRGRSFSQSITDIGGGTWKGILSISAIMFVVLIPFFAFAELGDVLGEGRLAQIFLHHRHLATTDLDIVRHSTPEASPEKRASA